MTPAETRFVELYLSLARQAEQDPHTLQRWIGCIERAWKLAQQSDRLVLEFIWAMEEFFRLQGLSHLYLEWATRGLLATERLNDVRARGVLLATAGWIMNEVGKTHEGVHALREAVSILDEDKYPAEHARARLHIGLILLERDGQTEAARTEFERALSLARHASAWKVEAKTVSAFSALESAVGNLKRSLELLDQTLDIYERHRDLEGQATTLNHRGMRQWELGRIDEARESYQGARTLREKLGDQRGIAQVLDNLAILDFENGDYNRALDGFLQAVDIEEALHDAAGQHATLDNIGVMYYEWGKPEKAVPYHDRALSIADAMKSKVARAITLTIMAVPLAAVGQVERAVASLDEALTIHDEGSPWQATALHNKSLIVRRYQSNPRQAIELAVRALTIQRKIGRLEALRRTASVLSQAYEDIGDFDSAEQVRLSVPH
jgi:tetratricopeptide (TPR) repeat protein